MAITTESQFLSISGTYDTRYGKKSFTKTLLFPVEWFQVEDLETFAKSIEIELSFGEIDGKHSECFETGHGSIVDLETAIKLAQETIEDGYDYDDWMDTEGQEVFDKLFATNKRDLFDKFRTEFSKALKEKTANKVKFEVSVPEGKQEEFERFLKVIEADFKKI